MKWVKYHCWLEQTRPVVWAWSMVSLEMWLNHTDYHLKCWAIFCCTVSVELSWLHFSHPLNHVIDGQNHRIAG